MAVLFAAAVIAALLVASLMPVVVEVAVGVALVVGAQAAVAAPSTVLPPRLKPIWDRLNGGRAWPSKFNWPPAADPTAGPPGICTAQEHRQLEDAKDVACENPLVHTTCDGGMPCGQLQATINAVEQCVAARLDVMDRCFLGGDAGHWEAIRGRMAQLKNCTRCLARQEAKQCRGSQGAP